MKISPWLEARVEPHPELMLRDWRDVVEWLGLVLIVGMCLFGEVVLCPWDEKARAELLALSYTRPSLAKRQSKETQQGI